LENWWQLVERHGPDDGVWNLAANSKHQAVERFKAVGTADHASSQASTIERDERFELRSHRHDREQKLDNDDGERCAR
jgi:hypothetical protein